MTGPIPAKLEGSLAGREETVKFARKRWFAYNGVHFRSIYMNEALYFHFLNTLPGCGAKTIRAAVAHFGSAEKAWRAPESDWSAIQTRFNATGLDSKRAGIDFESEQEKLRTAEIDIVPFTDPNFPTLLHEIPNPPALLYVRGTWRDWNTVPCVALVGSRDYSPYGKQVTDALARQLSQAGIIIVSGLAFGIDSLAHEAALATDMPTVAVLGGGIDDAAIAPQSHLRLAHEVIHQGALISEYAPGTKPGAGTFPARNRIIAGMTLGTLVIEAKEESGSLITARLALDFNREVFAVPGSIFSPLSFGTNSLLRQGAKLVTGVQDILNELQLEALPSQSEVETPQTISLSDDEQKVLATLSQEALHIDRVTEISRLETTLVASILTKLEMRGLVKNIGSMQYIKI